MQLIIGNLFLALGGAFVYFYFTDDDIVNDKSIWLGLVLFILGAILTGEHYSNYLASL